MVERELGRPVLPALHGCYSLGTVVGAGLGVAGAAAGFPVPWHLAGVLLLVTGMFAVAVPGLRPGIGRPGASDTGAAGPAPDVTGPVRERLLYLDPRLLLIGGVVLGMTLAEGAATDWLPLLMVDGHHMPSGLGSLVYAGFAAAMAAGRFAGGPVVARAGRPVVLGGGALLTAVGIALVSFVDSPVAAGCAVLLWGIGTSLGFPLALSAAGESGPDTTGRVALTSRIGYVALLAGPPSLASSASTTGCAPRWSPSCCSCWSPPHSRPPPPPGTAPEEATPRLGGPAARTLTGPPRRVRPRRPRGDDRAVVGPVPAAPADRPRRVRSGRDPRPNVRVFRRAVGRDHTSCGPGHIMHPIDARFSNRFSERRLNV